MRTPFEGQQRPKPISAPVVMEVMNEECPNCGCKHLCVIEAEFKEMEGEGESPLPLLKKAEMYVATYAGCPACPWASPAILRAKS
jgi:hypothetical protein